jgi:hypothetical protein
MIDKPLPSGADVAAQFQVAHRAEHSRPPLVVSLYIGLLTSSGAPAVVGWLMTTS